MEHLQNTENKCYPYAPTVLRIALGLLFIIAGISKLINPGMIIGMLKELGFPLAGFLGWILLLSEVGFGAAVLLGWQTKYTVWPLVIVLAVATVTVGLPALGSNPMAMINVLFHLVGIAALVSVYFSGAGAYALRSS